MEELAGKILLCCRNELYSLYPFLDGAFGSLPFRVSTQTKTIATDGEYLQFDARYLINLYGDAPEKLRRGYLHMLLHCLYLHPFRRAGREKPLWDLACDMAVEQILCRENHERLDDGVKRQEILSTLGEKPLPAETIYALLQKGGCPREPERFRFDDHSLWETRECGDQWEKVLSYTAGNGRGAKMRGRTAGDRQEQLENISGGPYDYRKFLRKFAVPREEMELDMDSFDYIYYNLGLERYGNLPLMEPLEYREGHKLEQLVIAIDTSGSCSREVVRGFLQETYSILCSKENFFRKMQVYLIQCDCMIQSVEEIKSREQWKNYSRSVTIHGRGGTDFTPVFRFVAEKQQEGKLRNLKALLYFTDGDGCYPTVKPEYETAFVFLKRNEHMEAVPSWARVLLTEDCI